MNQILSDRFDLDKGHRVAPVEILGRLIPDAVDTGMDGHYAPF
jgi:hypothetical protein